MSAQMPVDGGVGDGSLGYPPSPVGRRVPLVELAVLGVSVVVVFAVLIWFVGPQELADTPESAGSSLSAGRRGALALYRWLEKSGFEVQRVSGEQGFPPDADILFMINPNNNFPEGQAGSVRRWVEEGNLLILALGSSPQDVSTLLESRHPMLRELGVGVSYSFGYTDTVPVSQPVFNRPAVSRVKVPGIFGLNLPVSDTLVLVSAPTASGQRIPVAASIEVGRGKVIILASAYPLSNLGLKEEDNGSFVYNLVQMSGGRRVAFDEVHHGVSTGGDLIALLTGNPWGWALIYAALLAGIYMVWSARRLGPPLPVRTPDQRRPTSDYIISVARLFRRARKPGYVAERYLQFFRRTLSQRAALDPYITDERFVQALAERGRHPFNPDEMLVVVRRLRELAGDRPGNEAVELQTLSTIREAERLRRQALGIREEPGAPTPTREGE
jgi:hypothetical protein